MIACSLIIIFVIYFIYFEDNLIEHLEIRIVCIKNRLLLLFILFQYLEGPTKINFDILVSSFGPIQDIDMVCIKNNKILYFFFFWYK